MTAVIRGIGAVGDGITTASPGLPTGTAVGDLLICVTESHPPAVIAASGWTVAPSSPQQNSGGNTKLQLLYRVATGSGDAPSLTGGEAGTHVIGQVLGIEDGSYDSGSPFHTSSGSGSAVASFTITIPGLTTSIDDCLILACAGIHDEGTASSPANSSLSSVAIQINVSTSVNENGAILAISGVKATAGVVGDTTATNSINSLWSNIALAIAPSVSVTGTGASTLAGVTSDGDGDFTPAPITGTGSSTLAGVTSAGSGTYTPSAITGSGATTLDGVVSAGSGTYTPSGITGSGASTLDGVTSDGDGTLQDPFIGTGASTLDGVTADGDGNFIAAITGTGASTLDGVTSIGTGAFAMAGEIGNVVCEVVQPLVGVCTVSMT